MDKTLFKAYVRTIVEEEVKRLLPEMLGEAVQQIKGTQLTESNTTEQKPSLDRGRLAELMGISYDGETLRATTSNLASRVPVEARGNVNPAVEQAINRNYSDLMKKMGI